MITPKEFGIGFAERIEKESREDTVGCKTNSTYGMLADMVFNSGNGDYLELGAWRGTSAIIVARTKKNYKLGGMIYCVDHFKGYSDKFIGTDDAVGNFKKYGVDERINITISPSRPFPLKDKRFACAFIDANHWGEEPYLDFVEIEGLVDKYILMDDYDNQKKHTVIACVDRILKEFGAWKIKEIGESCVLLERIT